MADERIIALDVGSQQISGAAFSKTSGGGLRLDKLHRSDLVGDPFDDAQRTAQSKMALKEVVGELKLKKTETKYVISSQPVLLKFASLPAIDGEKLEEIVGFEAQQHIPYPINDVVWGYQLVGDPGDFEVEVIIAAVKKDDINEIDDLVQASGIVSTGAEISPVAHYNALRFNYSDIEEPILLIDVGARTTDLIFMEGNKVFIRTIKLGGAEITKAIAKEFGTEYGVADQKKIADGFVALGGPYADHDDPEIAGMSKIIRNSLTRMHSEIMRTINFYRSNQDGSAPKLALLSGATTSLPFIREFFAEKLNIPIDHFNALRNVTVSKSLEGTIASDAHNLGALVGSALQQAGPVPAAIDLVPDSVKADRDMDARKPALMFSVAAVTALLLGLGFFFTRGTSLSDSKAVVINAKADKLMKANKEIDNLRAEIDATDRKQEPFVDAVRRRVYWVRAFDYLSDMMETDTMWVTSISPLSEGLTVIAEGGETLVSGGEDTPKVIDTILIKGLWRENDLDNRVVFNYFDRLKADAVRLVEAGRTPRFDLADKDVSQLINVDAGTDDDRFAYPWEMRLPLPVENQVKFTK